MPMIEAKSQQQTLQQLRAADAWNNVETIVSDRDEKMRGEYGSLVRGLPALILTDGLGQSLAFLKAKGKPHHIHAYNHLSKWVCKWAGKPDADLMILILSESSVNYRQYTSEALAYLGWLKRFAEAAELKSSEGVR